MLTISLILLLLSNAVTLRRDKSILYSRLAMIILLYSPLIAFNNTTVKFIESGLALYGGLFHYTVLTEVFQIFIFIVSCFILHLNSFYPREIWSGIESRYGFDSSKYNKDIINKASQQFRLIEYPLILIFVVLGASLLISSNNVISVFLSLELQSYGLYIISAMYRDSESATWAALTYFLLGGLSSCLIVLSTALLYANSGTTSLDALFIINNLSENFYLSGQIMSWYDSHYIDQSLIIMSVGLLFKVAAAPFHFWSPDVYDAIPTIVTTFVATIAKISIFVFLLEFVHCTSSYLNNMYWLYGLLISSMLSMVVGTTLGLSEYRIKRLLAYSTISHIGFILLALSVDTVESSQAFMFYLLQYTISNLNAFMILITIGFSLYPFTNKDKQYLNLSDKNNSPIQLISQIKGYFYVNPILAISLAITIFSFVGIPPLMGFFAKQMGIIFSPR